MYKTRLKLFSSIAALMLLVSCGSTSTDPEGSWGSRQTNNIVSLRLTPETLEVDVCKTITSTVSADILNSVINSDLPDNDLFLSWLLIKFQPLTSGAPPIAGSANALVWAAVAPSPGMLPITGLSASFIDSAAKLTYLSDLTSGAYTPAETYPSYRAVYEFSGTDLYGSSWGVTGGFDFKIGRYTLCSVAVSPQSLALTGLANLDDDTSDDITFQIGGGTLPFTVYSDTVSVIASPGALAPTARSFTVDPDSVGTDKLVTLTVQDSFGATATSVINVTTP
jgi:hypothetical protein